MPENLHQPSPLPKPDLKTGNIHSGAEAPVLGVADHAESWILKQMPKSNFKLYNWFVCIEKCASGYPFKSAYQLEFLKSNLGL